MDSSNILSCLSNPNKTSDDIRIALAWFKRNTDAFRDVTIETMTDILNAAKILEKYPNEIIIRQGDIGDCFYVLLSGTASVYINSDFSAAIKDEPSDHTTTGSYSKLTRSARAENAQKLKHETKKTVKDGDRKTYGEFIRNYIEGGCFGDLALINEENIRNASIIADDKCHLLSISKDLFDRAIRSYTVSLYKEKLAFINSHVLFKNWQPKLKHHLAMSLVKINVNFNQDIIVQGQAGKGLVLIKSGAAKVVIDIRHHHSQYLSYMAQFDPSDTSFQNQGLVTRDDIKTARSSRENCNKFKRDKIEISIVGANDIIGDIEFGFNFPTNLMTVTAAEMCEVYILENVHVERMISPKRNVSTMDILQDMAELKMNVYYKRCSIFGDLPLMKLLISEISTEDEMFSLTEHIDKQFQKASLLPIFKSGPLIDFYGPGSVFFRNQLKRKANKEKMTNAEREDRLQKRNVNFRIYNEQISASRSINVIATPKETRKSIFQSHQKGNTFVDWETSSIHLNQLESRMQSWMSNFETMRRTKTDLSADTNVLRLPRFQNDDQPEHCRFIVKYKKSHADNVDDLDSRLTGRKDDDDNSNEIGKKMNENLIRQYTEVEYFKLKEEMKVKEKKLSIFRIKHAL